LPNENNIMSPVTLISYGRSGSSLLSKIFQLHPEFSMVGETGNFAFDLWKGYEFSAGQIAPLVEDAQWISDEERAGRMVRSSFLSCFPDDKKQWFHKPIGVPIAVSSKFSEEEWDSAAIWYWNAINTMFPKAKFFTILRHPFDVVLSAKSYWGFDEASIWWNYAFMAYLLSHPLCPIKFALSYEEMVINPESAIKSLFEYIEVPFDERVMQAFNKVHAAAKGRESVLTNGFSRKNEWAQLNNAEIKPKYFDIILACHAKYNKAIELPAGAYEDISRKYNERLAADTSDEPIDRAALQEIISSYNRKIESINSENSKNMSKREKEFAEIFLKDQKWMAHLVKEKQASEERLNYLRSHWGVRLIDFLSNKKI